jgi:8-amino-7-oxononanoate synthase
MQVPLLLVQVSWQITVITALSTLGNVSIYSDALNHASIIDAIRLARAK